MTAVRTRADVAFAVAISAAAALVCAGVIVAALATDGSIAETNLRPAVLTMALIIGVAASLAPVLQSLRILRTHSARDVSLILMGVFSLSYVAGLGVGLMTGMPVLWIPNSIGVVTMTTAFAVSIRMRWIYRHWRPAEAVRRDSAATGAVIHLGADPAPPAEFEAFDALDDAA